MHDSLKKKRLLFILREREEGREKGRERNIDVCEKQQLAASHTCPKLKTRPTHVPQHKSDQRPFALQDDA